MVFISRKDIYGKLKEKKLVESRVEFDSTCRKGNGSPRRGRYALWLVDSSKQRLTRDNRQESVGKLLGASSPPYILAAKTAIMVPGSPRQFFFFKNLHGGSI
ncbi:Hypothetical protein FKW44_016706 [Caligus rogercresseyi]|uniref:Uncharacterized protein n=1 Tax=Caligus rogercresseyi TaxID=217165 RepID=A0A7T8H320_CALRO|nr:Hypothetical protein FKW44_016706 [Caligus rogercresseyi]